MHKAGVDIKPMTYGDFNSLYRKYLVPMGQARLKGAVQMIINPVALW